MSRKFMSIAAAVAMALGSSAAGAIDLGDAFAVRAYGTAALTHSDEDQADFMITPIGQPEGAGHSKEWSPDVDSKLAVQVDMNLTERLTGVVQVISESAYNNTWDGDPNDKYKPSLEWANLSYKVSDALTVRAGRIVLPFLMNVEYRKVGFAQHWMRPPVEVYGSLPFASSDGVDASYRTKAGNGFNTVRGHYGYTSIRAGTFKSQVKEWGINDTYEIGSLSLRAAYLSIFMESPEGFGGIFDMFTGIADNTPGGAASAAEARALFRKYDPSFERNNQVYTVGMNYDPGQWFVMSEIVRTKSEGMFGSSDGGYVSGGYRVGSFTPYATYARVKSDVRHEDGIALNSVPGQLVVPAAMLNGFLNAVVNGDSSQQTLSAGVRWDFAKNFAFKAQYDHIDLDKGSSGQLSMFQPGFVPGGNVNVFSVAVDFVF